MDNRVGRSLSVQQAAELLRQQWRLGVPDLVAVVAKLIDFSTLSILELVVVDAEEAKAVGKSVQFSDYLSLFPQLEGQDASFSQMVSSWSTIAPHVDAPSQPPVANESTGAKSYFSAASVDAPKTSQTKPKIESEKKNDVIFKAPKTALPVVIGNFYCDLEIGRGSFGQVLRCKDKNLGRTVAIKIKEASDDKGLSEGFLHEARSISRLEHPNIVRLLQADETEAGVGYLVYEYVDGETLDKRVKRGDYSIKECVTWIASIAEALDYAHRHGVIHRDVSPRNIMISADGSARLLDFGLSSIDNAFYIEDRNRVLGTPNFMPPEQASGNPHWATSYADQFSLGSVLYYALTGKAPFSGSSTCDVLERVQKASPASLRSIRPEIPRSLERVCLKALAKEPQKRFSTGADMAAALLNSIQVPPPVATPSPRPNSLPLIAIGALLAIVGLVVSIWGIVLLSDSQRKTATHTSLEIEDFDLLVQDGKEYSLLFDRQPNSFNLQKPPNLKVTTAQLDSNYKARVFVFNGKTWSNPKEADETATTSIDKADLALGQNLILFVVSKDSPIDRSQLCEKPLYFDDPKIVQHKSTESTSIPEKLQWTINNVYVAKTTNVSWPNSQKLEAMHLGEMKDAAQLSSKELKEERRRWNQSDLRLRKEELLGLKKGNKDEVAYCAIAIWIDEPQDVEKP